MDFIIQLVEMLKHFYVFRFKFENLNGHSYTIKKKKKKKKKMLKLKHDNVLYIFISYCLTTIIQNL